MQKKYEIIPRIMWIPVVLALVINTIAYNGSRIFTTGWFHYDLSNRLDDFIPFMPWTVSIYLGCYAFWIVNYMIGCRFLFKDCVPAVFSGDSYDEYQGRYCRGFHLGWADAHLVPHGCGGQPVPFHTLPGQLFLRDCRKEEPEGAQMV